MNKNGVIAVVVVVVAIILVGLWAVRSGGQADNPDCAAAPSTPQEVTYSMSGRTVTIGWAPAPPGERVATYLIEATTTRGINPTTFVAPGSATSFEREGATRHLLRARAGAQRLRHERAIDRAGGERSLTSERRDMTRNILAATFVAIAAVVPRVWILSASSASGLMADMADYFDRARYLFDQRSALSERFSRTGLSGCRCRFVRGLRPWGAVRAYSCSA